MARRNCIPATKWHVLAWTTNLVFATGLGISVLAGCSGTADSEPAASRAVTGVDDSRGLASAADRDDEPSPGPATRDATGDPARADLSQALALGNVPNLPLGGDSFPPVTPGPGSPVATLGNPAVDRPLPELPEGFVLRRPAVVLSAGHEALCRVRVGDAMPSFTLPDVVGQNTSLPELLGSRLTVVVFWTQQQPYAAEQFERLGAEIVAQYGEFGVRVVAVNVGDSRETVQAAAERVGTALPVLLDEDGTVLETVGTGKLPRTYLLDPVGRILWFDIEYSESTRRDLDNAILWHQIKEPTIATR